jgi:hypothetical protein
VWEAGLDEAANCHETLLSDVPNSTL